MSVLLACCPCALALNPSLDVSQYAHTAWKIRDGFAKGEIESIAQTPDGYLWLGTQFGLLRFDGVRTVPWQPPAGEQLPSDKITRLLVARDGTLWIGTWKGLASWKDRKLSNYAEFAGQEIVALLEDREGAIWFGTFGLPTGKLCGIRGAQVQCNEAGSLGRWMAALYEDHKGSLWASTDTGLWQWMPGPPKQYKFPHGIGEANSLIEDDSGALLIATNDGLKQLLGGSIQSYALRGVVGQFRPNYLFRSWDGSLWVGGQQGLLHLHQGRIDRFAATDGLSGDFITSIFEDREGSVWVGTLNGLDRFREFAVPTISLKQGLSSSATWSVQATADGSIWMGTPDGLNRWQNGHMTVYGRPKTPAEVRRPDQRVLSISGAISEVADSGLKGAVESLGKDDRGRLWVSTSNDVFWLERGRFIRVPGIPGEHISSIAGDDNGRVWVLNGDAGLSYWTPEGAVQQIRWPRTTQTYWGVLLPDRLQGGIWLGFSEGGIAHLKDGQVRASYNAADGLGDGRVSDLQLDSDGAVWAATEGGLSRVKDGRVTTLSSKNGLPCDTVHWSMEDDDHAVWLYMPCGLVRIARSELKAWVRDSKSVVQITVFDSSDGLRSTGILGFYGPHVTKSPDGRIWFLPGDGVSVIDPHHLPINKIPPPVHIEQITADRKRYDAASGKRLPALTRDLEIEYTALSLVAPEKNRFKYKLEGYDRDWQDAGSRRQAFYTNLRPRRYRFRVIASNNSGVWNEAGDTLDFSIDPAYYQTNWFRALCVTAFLALLWVTYRRRVRQLARDFNLRVEERVNERSRIARELHDTLLQSVQASLVQMQVARTLVSRQPEQAVGTLDQAIETAEGAIAEGRDAIQELRSQPPTHRNLPKLLTFAGQELASAQTAGGKKPAAFRVTVEGELRKKKPLIQDEAYRIGRELLRNAFQHADASEVEATIRYEDRTFRLRVRDDGKGIDPKILASGGRTGHWGLLGMRERAKQIGGHLDIWSQTGAGTEVELSIPGATAYEAARDGRRLFALFHRKRAQS